MSLANTAYKKRVFDFKESYCDENRIIIGLLQKELYAHCVFPLLDVGAGTGDIAFSAFAGRPVTLLDTCKRSRWDYPVRPEHKRITCDFFDFVPHVQYNTIFVSHSLQFLDEDIERLNLKIQEINATNVIVVVNENNDFMGSIMKWSKQNFSYSNPEVVVPGFPEGYMLTHKRPFLARIRCPNFSTLAKQISYLMLVDLKENSENLILYLKRHLELPEFSFNQTIYIYQKK